MLVATDERAFVEADVQARMSALVDAGILARWNFEQSETQDAYILWVELSDGECQRYILSGLELLQGGPEGFNFWLDTVERDIRARSFYRNPMTGIGSTGGMDFARNMMACSSVAHIGFAPRTDPKAAAKAAELFRMACGKEAFDTLESGGALPITGSNGTAYTLHKRSSYCVERVSDGARLCAVVPGVPLYDHLLGIKLMIEHDEPKFLKTANVAAWSAPSGIYHAQLAANTQTMRVQVADQIMRYQQLQAHQPQSAPGVFERLSRFIGLLA